MLFGAAYYPEHRDPNRWVYDLDNMAAAAVNAVRVGEFAWVRFEPQPGTYDFAWLDRFLDLAHARGIGLLLCPPLRTAPAWLVEEDPSMLIVREDGVRLEFGSRYTFCINHPRLRDQGLALAERMAEHYSSHPGILGWHLDNEHGDEPDCHCDRCKAKWQDWLRQRYTSIEALNEAWGTVFWGLEFGHFGQVPTPRVTKAQPNPALLLAWRRFRSDCTVEMVGQQAGAVRKHTPQFVTTNNQALWNNRTDYYDLARHLDVTGTNYYPPYGADGRAIALGLAACRGYKGQNFQLHELRSGSQNIPGAAGSSPAPGDVTRLTLHCVANGADAIFYFRWRICPFGAEQHWGAITDYDGRPTRVYDEVKSTGEGLRRLAPLLDDTEVVSEVAVLYDFPTRWLTETGVPLNVHRSFYLDHAKLLYRVARAQGMNCDAVGRNGDFARYRVLLAPPMPMVDDTLAARLSDYVAGGGTLLWHPWSGMKDADAKVYPERLHPTLAETLGVRAGEYIALPPGGCALRRRGLGYEAGLYVDLYEPHGAEVEGELTTGWYAGKPAVFRHSFGKGVAITLATFPEERFYADFLAGLFIERSVQPILSGIPPEVEIAERRTSNGRQLIFLLNYSDRPQAVPLTVPMRDQWAEEDLTGTAPLPPHGVRVLTTRKR
ncbi:MAG: beta-galactosidase [Armatimonadota bacterium]